MTTRRKLYSWLIFFCVLAGCRPAVARDKENSEIKFTSRTELVLIPALVTDKSGNHIGGLKKEDFTVLENGDEQKIATFEEITSSAQRSTRRKLPGEFSNSLAGDAAARRVTLIVLDLINTSFVDRAYARKELIRYLTMSVDQREPTGLFTLSRSGVHVVHDFTGDPRVLAAALRKVKGDASQIVDSASDVEAMTGSASPDGSAGVDPGAVQTEAQQLQTMLEDAELNFQSFQQRVAITYTLQALQQIAQALGGFPGRKALIWAGGSFPFSVSDNTMQLTPAGRDSLSDVMALYEHTWQLLNNAQIALYPIDAKGLQVLASPGASVRNPGKNYGRNMILRNLDTQSTMNTFAEMTGGRAYYNSNDLVKGVRDAVHDSEEYYMLGYYLNRAKTKAGWRKLAVKVRRDHTQVRARSGFFVTDATVDSERNHNNDISSALQAPFDYTTIPVVAHWDKTEPSKEPGKKRVVYEIHLAPDASLIDNTENNHLALEFVAQAKTPEGAAVDHPSGKTVDMHLTADRLATLQQTGLSYRGALDLAPGEYTVRLVVRDNLSGRMGSVAAPLKVE